eukprot:s206_g23.t1
MANLSADKCAEAHLSGRYFTLEHPARSLAQFLPSWKRLLSLKGVKVLYYNTCMFEGSRRKNQLLIYNNPCFDILAKVCQGRTICNRTNLKHLKWRPTTSGGKVLQFTTGDEREYPIGFCRAYASCAKSLLGSSGKFVEVFSGPNAPLSRAVCEEIGEPLRGSRVQTDKGLKVELQRLSQVLSADPSCPEASEVSPAGRPLTPEQVIAPESLVNRVTTLEAGKQPSYGKRQQLIPDGLNSIREHLEKALRLPHPFNTMESLKEDHRKALEAQVLSGKDMNELRLKVLADWRQLSGSLDIKSMQQEHDRGASQNARRLGRKLRTALMEILGKRHGLEDRAVPQLCLTGMPIVGSALESPFFENYDVPAAISLAELLASAQRRRQSALRRVEFMAKRSSVSQAEAILKKTNKEVAQGTMGGPFGHEELVKRHGAYYNVIRYPKLRFGAGDR